MIEFKKHGDHLLMRYSPERGSDDWLVKPLESEDEIPLSGKAFHVRQEIYRTDIDDGDYGMDPCYRFIVGHLVDGYYQMDRHFLGIEYDLFMHRSIKFRRTTFVAETNIPIFRGFNNYGFTSLRVGGEHPDALPTEVFEEMLRQFPNTYELKKYARARVSSMIRNYVPISTDPEADYLKYRQRKASAKGSQPKNVFGKYEVDKFSALVQKIEDMLGSADTYTENQWQDEIIQIIQFLYPKYITAIKEAPVRDSLAGKDRQIDFLMVDASGYVDAVEIKKPFAECIITSNCYRDNHVPVRELNGTVMQLEKYLYHLNRWGQQGETKLNERYASILPNDVTIKIVNPSGMIIMGRDQGLTLNQKADFEVIRRKYRNVLEIMTYDNLLRRLETIRDQLGSGATIRASGTAA